MKTKKKINKQCAFLEMVKIKKCKIEQFWKKFFYIILKKKTKKNTEIKCFKKTKKPVDLLKNRKKKNEKKKYKSIYVINMQNIPFIYITFNN